MGLIIFSIFDRLSIPVDLKVTQIIEQLLFENGLHVDIDEAILIVINDRHNLYDRERDFYHGHLKPKMMFESSDKGVTDLRAKFRG